MRFPRSDGRPLAPLWIAGAAFAGVVAFLLVNVVLYLDGCQSTEFIPRCPGSNGRHALTVLVIIAALAGLAGVSRRARAFAVGFGGGLVLLTVVSMGACTTLWMDPYVKARQTAQRAAAPTLERRKSEREAKELRSAWTALIDSRPMDVRRGVQLAAGVARCVRDVASDRGGALPARDAELFPRCNYLKDLGRTADVPSPPRYVMTEDGDAVDAVSVRMRGDVGWRWEYEATSAGFTVRVVPDAQLSHDWPRVYADDSGRVEVLPSPDGDPIAMSPVDDLRTIVTCLKEAMAEDEGRGDLAGEASSGHLTRFLQKSCPAVGPRLARVRPLESNQALLSLLYPPGAPPSPDAIAAVYDIQYVVRHQGRRPVQFDLTASSVAGMPAYLATFEGPVHATLEPRAATTADPIAGR
jgi:hypothetical protein